MAWLLVKDGKIVNTIEYDESHPYIPDDGSTLVQYDGAYNIGWDWDGNKAVEPLPPPPKIPKSVTPRQVRLLLLQQGLLSQVEATIATMDQATQITWQYAIEFHRDDPLLNALANQLGLTEQQVDEFFIAAYQL